MVYEIENSQDKEIAKAKLDSIGVNIDSLTEGQQKYLEGFNEGT